MQISLLWVSINWYIVLLCTSVIPVAKTSAGPWKACKKFHYYISNYYYNILVKVNVLLICKFYSSWRIEQIANWHYVINYAPVLNV